MALPGSNIGHRDSHVIHQSLLKDLFRLRSEMPDHARQLRGALVSADGQKYGRLGSADECRVMIGMVEEVPPLAGDRHACDKIVDDGSVVLVTFNVDDAAPCAIAKVHGGETTILLKTFSQHMTVAHGQRTRMKAPSEIQQRGEG